MSIGRVIRYASTSLGVIAALVFSLSSVAMAAGPAPASRFISTTAPLSAWAPYISKGTLLGVTAKANPQAAATTSQNSTRSVSPEWTTNPGYFLQNVNNNAGEVCGTNTITEDSAPGPTTLYLTVNQSVSATWSANVGISAEVVSEGIGWSVTSSYGVSQEDSIYVPAGSVYELQAHPLYSVTTFDVWYDPVIGNSYYVGSGEAYKPVGVCFSYVAY